MAEQPDPETPHRRLHDLEMEYIRAHPGQLDGWTSRERILRWSLGIGFVLGLIAHVVGYLLKIWATSEPFGLLAELLYAFGFALWTGVAVTLFVQVLPDVKARQAKRALAEYESWKQSHEVTRQP